MKQDDNERTTPLIIWSLSYIWSLS